MGRRLHGDDWVGTEPKIFRLRVVASTDDLRKEIEPSQHAPDLPTEEVTLPFHFEANAQDHSQDEEQRAARQRCIDAEKKLRKIMSTRPVKSWMRDSERGVDEPLTQAQWDPAYNSFWIKVASGFCGDSGKGQEGGPGLIDCADFDAAIEDEFGIAQGEDGQADTQGLLPGISDNWSFAETFRFEEIVYLLCGYEPVVGLDHEIRRKLLPASIPGEELLMSAMRSGDLLLSALASPIWHVFSESQIKAADYHPDHVVNRSELQKLVAAKWPGKRPKFLFPEGQPAAATTGLTPEMQSAGGQSQSQPLVSLLAFLTFLQNDIDDDLTLGRLVHWFEDKGITSANRYKFSDDFYDSYIDLPQTRKSKIYWSNKKTREDHNRALSSLRLHYPEVNKRKRGAPATP